MKYSRSSMCTRKIRFGTIERAEKGLERFQKAHGTAYRIYACPICEGFHLTTQRAVVPEGPKPPELCFEWGCDNHHAKGKTYCKAHEPVKNAIKEEDRCQAKGCPNQRRKSQNFCGVHLSLPFKPDPERRKILVEAGIIKASKN